MRTGIRQQLINSKIGIIDCYEPNVPNKETPKPYAVVLQSDDTKNNETVGFKRTIEIYFYVKRTSFKSLDEIVDKAIKALHMQTIEDHKTHELFTCIFNGIIGQDGIDQEWDALYRGVQFNVIALHDDNEENTDKWLDSIKEFTSKITNLPIYLNTWQKNFAVPSILWRVQSQSKEREINTVVRENKTLICHVVSESKNEIHELIDNIENRLIDNLKIPYDLANRRYLTIEKITEDREADMLTKGQLTIDIFRRRKFEKERGPIIKTIRHRGTLKE